MLIDWFTVGAQALNFVILVWLMKRFLYKPILHAIDVREQGVAAKLAEAEAKRTEAKKEQEDFRHKNEEFDQQRSALLAKATDEAKSERQRLIDEAQRTADALTAKWQEALGREAHDLNHAIGIRTQNEVFAVARRALADLATTSLEERMGEVFTRRLRQIDGATRASLGKALETASQPAVVRSAFDLPSEQRAAIQNALNETFSAEIHIAFEIAPELVSGIELATGGQKVAWTIAEYLTSMEKHVAELVKDEDKPEAKAEPKPEAKAEPKPEAKAEPGPDARAEARPKPKPSLAHEAKSQ